MRPITGAEVTLTDGSHVTLLVESAQGYANLCRLLTAAHAGTRPKEGAEPLPPSLDARLLAELNEGLVCLSGCARHGLAVRNPNGAGALARAFGPERFFVELQRPYERGDASRLAALRDLAEALGVRTVATGDVHSHHPRAHVAPGRPRRDPPPHLARRLRGGAAREPGERPAPAGRAGRQLPARPRRRRAHRRAGRAAGVRPDRGPRLPLSGLLGHGRAGDRAAQARLRPRVRRALRGRERPQAQGAPPARGGAEADRGARARGVLSPPLGGAGAGAGVRA